MQHPYPSVGIGTDDASTLGSRGLDAGVRDDASLLHDGNAADALPRIMTAGHELESFCRAELSGGDASIRGYPPTCLKIVRLLAGNHCCVDCGDDASGRLLYASVGYGTVLCRECAHRHVTVMAEESDIKSLRDDNWTFRSTLALLEGGNARMLDYFRHKPRWRPPKTVGEDVSEDVVAFRSIYFSKASGDYRKNLAKQVDELFDWKIEETRDEDAALEERMERLATAAADPFQSIYEQNELSEEDMSGFFGGNTSPQNGDSNNERAGDVRRLTASRATGATGASGRSRRTLTKPLMKPESPSKDRIKERINLRRSMNASIAAQQLQALEDSERDGSTNDAETKGTGESPFSLHRSSILASQLGGKPAPNPAPAAIASRYAPKSNRRGMPQITRRNSDNYSVGLVGEVGDTSLKEHGDDQTAYTSLGDTASYYKKLPGWERNIETYDDDRTAGRSYSLRVRTPPQLGSYTGIQGGDGRLGRRSEGVGGRRPSQG